MKIYAKHEERENKYLVIDFERLTIANIDTYGVELNDNFTDQLDLLDSAHIYIKDYEQCDKHEVFQCLNNITKKVSELNIQA